MNNYKPETIKDALKLISSGVRPVAGGTDVMVRNHAIRKTRGTNSLPPLFSTKNIPGFQSISVENKPAGAGAATGRSIKVGAGVSLAELINSGLCPSVLREALASIASPGIRNTATLAGNICNASPAADSLPALYILDALLETAAIDKSGNPVKKLTPVSDFITGPGRTLLGGSILTAVIFNGESYDKQVFRKVGTRAANALSKLSIAACWNTENGVFTDFRLAVGACAPTVVRSRQAEDLVKGTAAEDTGSIAGTALDIYAGLLKPIDDQRSSADYRKNTALKLIKDIIIKAEK